MTAAVPQPTHLRYHPHETLAAFQVRQRHAYQVGKTAWRAGLISAQALQLYEELVRYVGGNRCAWVKEETLAAELHRSASTIKRWMQQLVQAQLIRRGRRLGATRRTSLTAYDPADLAQEPDDSRDVVQPTLPLAVPPASDRTVPQAAPPDGSGEDAAAPGATALADGGTTTPPPAEPVAASAPPAAHPALFFEPRGEPSISSGMRRDSVKT